tara:strand:- start:773 stop:1054 length:282 start_codon:yes stop_codon:yes gene_type:complete
MDRETVRTICYLARLEIDQNKSEKIQNDLETIIELIGTLQSTDTSDVEPLYNPLEMTAFLHEDLEVSDNKKDKFLKSAAKSNEDYFLVPRVVE